MFSKAINTHFNSSCGAFTTITQAEINKQTFNVKAVMRNLLISSIGRDSIPNQHSSNQHISFCLSEELSMKYGKCKDIVCKFSKYNKDEMSIYFSNESFLSKNQLNSGDYWFIFFKENNSLPWFGFLKSAEWNILFEQEPHTKSLEKNTNIPIRELNYNIDITNVKIIEDKPPKIMPNPTISEEQGDKISSNSTHSIHCVNTTDRSIQENNKKIKGTMGEKLVVEFEKEKLKKAGRLDLVDKIDWIAEKYDGYGYDIISYEIDENNHEKCIYIEVKSTSGSATSPFEITLNEIATSEENGDNYYIYRVFNLHEDSKEIHLYRLKGKIQNHFNLKPIVYRATLKIE